MTQAKASEGQSGGGMLLDLDHVSKIYGDLHALDDLNLSVPQGQWLAVVGSSGSGKTTLMNEQQRVCVARALINEPKLILADEPTGNLDEANERIVLDLFRQLHDQGTSLIVVTHDALVASCAQREIMLNHGVLAGEQWNDEQAKRAYLAAGGRPAFIGAPGDSGDQDIPVGFHDPTKIAKTGGSLPGSAAESEGGR